jgi:[ribosomal protein S18]-alanine N-acetyltransferase
VNGSVRLRRYQPGDLKAIFALDEVCFAPPFRFSLGMMRRFAEARHALTVIAECPDEQNAGDAGRESEIAGFCIAHVERSGKDRMGYIITLDVAPERRRQGLARHMMEQVEEEARAAGCSAMALHVSLKNEGALRFYEREGYVRSRFCRDFYGRGLDAFVYRKSLVGETAE